MKKIITFSLIVLLTSNRAFALDPLGPPTASQKQEMHLMPNFWKEWAESQTTDTTFWREWAESQTTDTTFQRDWAESQTTDPNYTVELEFIYGEMDLHAESLSMATSKGTLQFSSA